MVSFDYPINLENEYRKRLHRRVETANQTIKKALTELRRSENRSPATWEGLLRQAKRAYRDVFGPTEDRATANAILRAVETIHHGAYKKADPDLDDSLLGLDLETRAQLLVDQLDSMRMLIDRYYRRLEQPETDENGFIVVAGLAAAVEKTTGIIRRRGSFYARDQVGHMYKEVSDQAAATAGAEEYVWLRTTAKNPRERHLDRVGKVFRYDDPIDHPGDLYNCQCGRAPRL